MSVYTELQKRFGLDLSNNLESINQLYREDKKKLDSMHAMVHADPSLQLYFQVYSKSIQKYPSEQQLSKLLTDSGIRVNSQYKKFQIKIIGGTINNYIIICEVTVGWYTLLLNILTEDKVSPSHTHELNCNGNYGKIYQLQGSKQMMAIKCFTYNQNEYYSNVQKEGQWSQMASWDINQESQISEDSSMGVHNKNRQKQNKRNHRLAVVYQFIFEYCLLKIASAVNAAPFIDNNTPDLIFYRDCVQFQLQMGYSNYSPTTDWCIQIKKNISTLHALRIVHTDIKSDNLVFSYVKNRMVFIDFGCSDVLEVPVFQKIMTRFKGNLKYSSIQFIRIYQSNTEHQIDLYYNDLYGVQELCKDLYRDKTLKINDVNHKIAKIHHQNNWRIEHTVKMLLFFNQLQQAQVIIKLVLEENRRTIYKQIFLFMIDLMAQNPDIESFSQRNIDFYLLSDFKQDISKKLKYSDAFDFNKKSQGEGQFDLAEEVLFCLKMGDQLHYILKIGELKAKANYYTNIKQFLQKFQHLNNIKLQIYLNFLIQLINCRFKRCKWNQKGKFARLFNVNFKTITEQRFKKSLNSKFQLKQAYEQLYLLQEKSQMSQDKIQQHQAQDKQVVINQQNQSNTLPQPNNQSDGKQVQIDNSPASKTNNKNNQKQAQIKIDDNQTSYTSNRQQNEQLLMDIQSSDQLNKQMTKQECYKQLCFFWVKVKDLMIRQSGIVKQQNILQVLFNYLLCVAPSIQFIEQYYCSLNSHSKNFHSTVMYSHFIFALFTDVHGSSQDICKAIRERQSKLLKIISNSSSSFCNCNYHLQDVLYQKYSAFNYSIELQNFCFHQNRNIFLYISKIQQALQIPFMLHGFIQYLQVMNQDQKQWSLYRGLREMLQLPQIYNKFVRINLLQFRELIFNKSKQDLQNGVLQQFLNDKSKDWRQTVNLICSKQIEGISPNKQLDNLINRSKQYRNSWIQFLIMAYTKNLIEISQTLSQNKSQLFVITSLQDKIIQCLVPDNLDSLVFVLNNIKLSNVVLQAMKDNQKKVYVSAIVKLIGLQKCQVYRTLISIKLLSECLELGLANQIQNCSRQLGSSQVDLSRYGNHQSTYYMIMLNKNNSPEQTQQLVLSLFRAMRKHNSYSILLHNNFNFFTQKYMIQQFMIVLMKKGMEKDIALIFYYLCYQVSARFSKNQVQNLTAVIHQFYEQAEIFYRQQTDGILKIIDFANPPQGLQKNYFQKIDQLNTYHFIMIIQALTYSCKLNDGLYDIQQIQRRRNKMMIRATHKINKIHAYFRSKFSIKYYEVYLQLLKQLKQLPTRKIIKINRQTKKIKIINNIVDYNHQKNYIHINSTNVFQEMSKNSFAKDKYCESKMVYQFKNSTFIKTKAKILKQFLSASKH